MADIQGGGEPYILVDLAGTTYGIPCRHVQHMEMVEEITPVPNAAPFVEGIVFSRSQVIPAINLRVRLGLERIPHSLRSRLVVVRDGNRSVGLVVDAAREFVSIGDDAIQPPPDTVLGVNGRCLAGVATLGKRVVLVLDPAAVIGAADGVPQHPAAASPGRTAGAAEPAA